MALAAPSDNRLEACPLRGSSFDGARDDALLRAIIDTTPECIKIVAPDGTLRHMNVAGLEMIEAGSWPSVAHKDVSDLIAPEDRARWRECHERVCRGEPLVWEFRIVGLGGTRRDVETHATPIELDDGRIGQLAITRDVTARKSADASFAALKANFTEEVDKRTRELEQALVKLRETERSFALLVDGVSDYALYMLDTTGRIVSWNVGAKRIKGYTSAEIIGRHFSCFYTDEDREARLPERGLRIAAAEGRCESEGWRVRKDGTRFWANVVIDAIRDKGELVAFAKITRDITERKATETRLRQAQKMEAVGQFTGGAAHDFNNLLMAILGSLDLLRKRLPNDAGMRALLDNAVQGARRGSLLTQRMLAFARRQELKREAVHLPSLVNSMTEFLAHSLGPLIEVRTSFPQRLANVRTDAAQLEIALQNLVINARDAMPGGGTITISARQTRVEAGSHHLDAGEYVCLAVADTGHGMDEATIAHATEPFFTTKGIGKGTGLGLSMVDGLMEQSGGRLIVHSQVGVGTTMELWLPLALGEAVATRDPAAPAPVPRASKKLSVLVVDDDPLVLTNIAAMLDDLGHEVIDVGSAAGALEIIDAGTPVDLIISDQAMPGMTGAQLLGEIRKRRPSLPTILATGYAELPAGTDLSARRLSKPFTQRELAEAVVESLRAR